MEDTILPAKHHNDFIWLYLTKTIGIDNIIHSFGNNDLPTKMVELFNESKSKFIAILNQQSDELESKKEKIEEQFPRTLFNNKIIHKDIFDLENELEKTRKILKTLQSM